MLVTILIPILILLGGIILSLIFGKALKGDISRIIGLLTIITAIVVTAVLNPFTNNQAFHGLITLDLFGGVFTYLFLSLAIFIIIGSMKMLDNRPEMIALVLFSTLGMILVSISNDLIVIFIAWEIMSLSTYILAGIKRTEKSTEAAVKYFIYGAVSSALVLYAISLVYGLTGTTKIDLIYQELATVSGNGLYIVGLFATIFIFGFGYKMGMIPFHLWLPDVYEGSPAPVTALLGGVAKKVALVATVRIFVQGFMSANIQWKVIFAVVAVTTMTLANIAALVQKRVFRMFAYSSVSQVGYMLIGFAVLTTESIAGMTIQLLVHAVTAVGVFITIGILVEKHGLKTMNDYKGLSKKKPVVSLSLALMVLSLAGIPPLAGFVSKFLLFKSAVDGGMTWLAIVAILNSVLSLGYYLPFLKNIFFDNAIEDQEEKNLPLDKDWRWYGPLTITILGALATILLAIFAQAIFNVLLKAAQLLFEV